MIICDQNLVFTGVRNSYSKSPKDVFKEAKFQVIKLLFSIFCSSGNLISTHYYLIFVFSFIEDVINLSRQK
jgi:hypothetical protein